MKINVLDESGLEMAISEVMGDAVFVAYATLWLIFLAQLFEFL